MKRAAAFDRRTTETQIKGRLVIDGQGRYDISTGIRFFDHMLELFTRHGGFDLTLKAKGDLDVDQHHTVEDVGITLGETVLRALGDRKGSIARAISDADGPDAMVAAIDLRTTARRCGPQGQVRTVGDLQTELVHDFSVGQGARAMCTSRCLGQPSHHHIEACSAFARALRVASRARARLAKMLPSTKGLPDCAD
jgi:imidazoleglycerol-phosphate dehydratase